MGGMQFSNTKRWVALSGSQGMEKPLVLIAMCWNSKIDQLTKFWQAKLS
jgi:hypothetical protein